MTDTRERQETTHETVESPILILFLWWFYVHLTRHENSNRPSEISIYRVVREKGLLSDNRDRGHEGCQETTNGPSSLARMRFLQTVSIQDHVVSPIPSLCHSFIARRELARPATC